MTSPQPAPVGHAPVDPWEAAYLRFETPEEEEKIARHSLEPRFHAACSSVSLI